MRSGKDQSSYNYNFFCYESKVKEANKLIRGTLTDILGDQGEPEFPCQWGTRDTFNKD